MRYCWKEEMGHYSQQTFCQWQDDVSGSPYVLILSSHNTFYSGKN